jgi:hypothetical protein
VLGLIALLLALRVLSGGPAIGGTLTAGGVWLGLQRRQIIALVAAVVLLAVGYMRIRKVLQPLEGGEPARPPSPPGADTGSDQDT